MFRGHRTGQDFGRWIVAGCGVLLGGVAATGAQAYTAAGDRLFPATILLPQIAPSDELYVTGITQPGPGTRLSNLSVTYDKTILERVGVGLAEGYNWVGRTGRAGVSGWQDIDVTFQYTPVIDAEHEFLLSLGGLREFGGTGALRAGASPAGATMPAIYMGKGLGDLDVEALRPIALAGILGYQLGDSVKRPDNWVAGFAIEYSIPYLVSKVSGGAVPDPFRALTPIVELFATTPAQRRQGDPTTVLLGPGLDYAGQGYEFGAEAQVPLSRAAGQGLGFTLQLHVSLDYFFPDSVGRPVFDGQ